MIEWNLWYAVSIYKNKIKISLKKKRKEKEVIKSFWASNVYNWGLDKMNSLLSWIYNFEIKIFWLNYPWWYLNAVDNGFNSI